MEKVVIQGDKCSCSNGSKSCSLKVVSNSIFKCNGKAVALETDATIANMTTFGKCNNIANPSVAQATAAANGVLTPMPCVPVLSGRWNTGIKKLSVNGMNAVGENSNTSCAYGGNITMSFVGERNIEAD